jgi:TetR/AcrR family transcriptional regulator
MSERRVRDKDKTIQDILSAAKELFSQYGLHGTSIRDIEMTSGVSKGLILHHFGSKEKLYAALQDELISDYVTTMEKIRSDESDFRRLVASTIRNSFRHFKDNLAYRRISLWSYLEGLERNNELEERFIKALVSAMQDGQQSGLVREDIDAFLMPFIIRGTIEYWIRKEESIRRIAAAAADLKIGSDDRLIDALSILFLKQ